MSLPPPPDFNPYQPPAYHGPPGGAFGAPIDLKILRRFRREIHGLGGVWIFLGVLAIVGVTLAIRDQLALMEDADRILLYVMYGVCGAWILLGLATCFKQMWAVWIGLILSYLSLTINGFRLIILAVYGGQRAICPMVILAVALLIVIFIILQAHRCIKFARQLTDAGVPLTAKPGDYIMN